MNWILSIRFKWSRVCTFRFKSINNNALNTWTLCFHFDYILIWSFKKHTHVHIRILFSFTIKDFLDTKRNLLTSVRAKIILVDFCFDSSFSYNKKIFFIILTFTFQKNTLCEKIKSEKNQSFDIISSCDELRFHQLKRWIPLNYIALVCARYISMGIFVWSVHLHIKINHDNTNCSLFCGFVWIYLGRRTRGMRACLWSLECWL